MFGAVHSSHSVETRAGSGMLSMASDDMGNAQSILGLSIR